MPRQLLPLSLCVSLCVSLGECFEISNDVVVRDYIILQHFRVPCFHPGSAGGRTLRHGVVLDMRVLCATLFHRRARQHPRGSAGRIGVRALRLFAFAAAVIHGHFR